MVLPPSSLVVHGELLTCEMFPHGPQKESGEQSAYSWHYTWFCFSGQQARIPKSWNY